MEESRKFPGGVDVKVIRKEDLIECIETNIIDKEVALNIVRQCELSAASNLRLGKWVAIPFTGTIRPSEVDRLVRSKEQQDLIASAIATATPQEYSLFRRQLSVDNEKRVKAKRYYDYVLSMAIKANRYLFKKLCSEKGEGFAKIHFFLNKSITAVDNFYDLVDYGENVDD